MCSPCDCKQPVLSAADELKKSCRKCGSEPFIVLDKVHVDCKQCFLEMCNKKFRYSIGKSKLLRNNESVLVAHSGGASSTALLDLIKSVMELESRREQKFNPSILHVDTFVELDLEKRRERLESVLEEVNSHYPDWPLYWTTIEMIKRGSGASYLRYDKNKQTSEFLNNPEAKRDFLASIEIADLTDRQQHIERCITELINQVAQEMNQGEERLNYIFVGSSATALANNLLVNVILGEGATIRSDVNVCDRRFPIPIVRPMRGFSKKEIAFYLKAKNLSYSVQTNIATYADRKASIQKVTEAFLSKLYVDYPATYTTLLRTGNKMQD